MQPNLESYSGPLWHVAYTEPRAERCASDDIAGELGFGTFLPLEVLTEVHRGRKVKVARPLFPRYLFVQVDPYREDWQEILGVAGVVDVLMASDDVPGHVPTASIEMLMKAEACGLFDRTTRFPNHFEIDELVRVTDGPFAGLNATIIEFIAKMRSATACKRAKVLLAFMGRMTEIDLPVTSLEKL